jgi:predicted TIM-barrel fold metal-dependent hydrolase
MIIDGHCHLKQDFSTEQLIRSMEEEGVDKTIAFGRGVEWNEYVAAAAREHPNEIIGFAWINPRQKNAADELIRSVEVLGLRGVKLHPYLLERYDPADHELLDPILELCQRYRLPIVIHGADEISPFGIEEMAKPFPEVTVVIAHMGLIFQSGPARLVAKRNPKIFLETSLAYPRLISRALEEVGTHKILMGTDKPAESATVMIHKIEEAVPKEEDRKLITGDNYAKILGFAS